MLCSSHLRKRREEGATTGLRHIISKYMKIIAEESKILLQKYLIRNLKDKVNCISSKREWK